MSSPRVETAYRRAMLWPVFVKEFRELRSMRWVAMISGPLVCLAMSLAVDAGNKGTQGFGMLAGYDDRTLLTQLMPVGLAGLWVVMGMLLSVHAFVAPNGGALEPFLLERPVKRSTVWWARLRGALLSAALTALLHFGFWVIFVIGRMNFPAAEEGGWVQAFTLGVIGLLVGVLAGSWSGVVSGEVPRGVLVGVILLVAPAGLAQVMGALFPYAIYWKLPYFYWVALLFWLLLAVGSYRAACFGEPAGAGRLRRAVKPALIGLGVSLLAFFVSADTIVRHASVYNQSYPEGAIHDEGFLIRAEAAWWIDVERRDVRRFFPPPVLDTAMNDGGTRLAVVHRAGRFGRLRAAPVLDIYDIAGRRLHRFPLNGGDLEIMQLDVVWAGDRIFFVEGLAEGMQRGFSIDPESGDRRELDLSAITSQRWTLMKPREDSTRLFLLDRDQGALLRLDTDDPAGRFERILVLAEGERFSTSPLSPRGTRVATFGGYEGSAECRGSNFIDLEEPSRRACGSSGGVNFWIDENRVVLRRDWKKSIYVEFNAGTGQILEQVIPVGEALVPSPDGKRAVSHGDGDRIVFWHFKNGLPEYESTLTEGLEDDLSLRGLGWANNRDLYIYADEGVYLLSPPERSWKRVRGRLPGRYRWYDDVRRR